MGPGVLRGAGGQRWGRAASCGVGEGLGGAVERERGRGVGGGVGAAVGLGTPYGVEGGKAVGLGGVAASGERLGVAC